MGKQLELPMTMAIPRGADSFWPRILKVDAIGPWSAGDIIHYSDGDAGMIRTYIKRLVAGGLAEPEGLRPSAQPGLQPSALYRLTKRPPNAPRLDNAGRPLPETGQETMWRSMKMLKDFAWTTIREAAEVDGRKIKVGTVKKYLAYLASVGVLAVITPGGPNVPTRYRLVRNLGGAAPRILSTRVVYDPNSNTILGATDVREAAI